MTMMRQGRRLAGDARGTSAVEFALTFPLLLLLMMGAIAIGQAFYTAASVQYAVERSARMLAVDADVTALQVEDQIKQTLGPLANIDVSIQFADDETNPITVARVWTSVDLPVSIPLFDTFNLHYDVETHVPRPFREPQG